MPPEPLSWDRKDFLKERKHERSESFGSVARWRESSHHARDFNRWGSGEIRRLQGHGRQRSWHMFSEESGHGYCPSWTSGHKMVEDERAMPSVWRGEGKHGRNGRESRSLSQRDWRGHCWETSNGHWSTIGRSQYDANNDHRSVNGIGTYPSHSQSHFGNTCKDSHDKGNTCNEIKPKDSHNKIRCADGLITGQKCEGENSLNTSDWKPMKWTRTASLSSRASGFNNSSSSKSLEILDTEAKPESLLKDGSLIQIPPPPTDLVVCPMSSPPSEDANSRKKRRLGWGEGLAKYEKKKIEDPGAGAGQDAVFSGGSGETSHSCGISLTGRNPVVGFSDCASPASPSVTCSSSPVVEEKSFGKTSSADSNLCRAPSTGQGSQVQLEGFAFIVERIKELDTSSFATLGSSLTELLQSNDLSSEASDYVRSAAINKLLLCKSEISKELEVAESEIDSLENELKLLISGTVDSRPSVPLSASPLPLDTNSRHRQVVCGSIFQSDPLETVEEIGGEDDISLAIAPSEPVQLISQVGELSSSDAVNSADDLTENEAGGFGEDSPRNLILVSNQEWARRASEVLSHLLSGCENKDRRYSIPSLKVEKVVEEKVARRKQFLKFQERVLGLKFSALQQLWKETHLASVRKSRTKPQKLSLRTANSGHQKHRLSTSRFFSPGNASLGSRAEVVDYAGKLLSESQGKACRNILKMPALILDKRERMASKFSSSNGLVEDPCAVEMERSMINPWTSEEREIFVDKLALFGKDFGKVAYFLEHKTTADCVEFYYKNHKSDDFQKTKKKLENSMNEESVSSTYLVTTGKMRNPKMDSAYLDMLGAASEMVAYENDRMRLREKFASKDDCVSDQTMSFDFTGHEKEAVAADVLAGIGGSLSSEAMSSCITSSIGPAEGYKKLKRKNVSSVVKRHLPHGIFLQADDETCSDESCGELEPFDWTDEEKSIFVQAVSTYGKDFVTISKCVQTKSRDQCKVFFGKARKCLGLDLIQTANRNLGTSASGDDGNEGGSDIEDACILESGSFTRGDKFCSKMDEDSRQSAVNVGDEDSSLPKATLTNQWRLGENCEPSTLNHHHERISAFDMDKEKDRLVPMDDYKVGVEGPEGGLGESVAEICSESLGYVAGEQKKVNTDTTHQTDLPCLVQVSSDNGSLLAVPSKHPCIISSPHEKSAERDGDGKDESNRHAIKQVASSKVPNGNSLLVASNRMDGEYYLKRCCTKPRSTGNELTFQLDKHEVMCKTSKNGGNVKLFGKILHHSSASLQTSNVRQNEHKETAKLSNKSELSENDHMAAGNLGFRKFDRLSYGELDKLRVSYETCKADSGNAIIPGAFALSTGGQEGARLSPFAAETKHSQDTFIEMQRRKGLKATSSLQRGLSGGASDPQRQHDKADIMGDKRENRW